MDKEIKKKLESGKYCSMVMWGEEGKVAYRIDGFRDMGEAIPLGAGVFILLHSVVKEIEQDTGKDTDEIIDEIDNMLQERYSCIDLSSHLNDVN